MQIGSMPWGLRLLAALFFGAAWSVCRGADLVFETNQSALSCLVTPSRDTLQYPRGAAERRTGGVVRIRLTFTAANAKPKAEVFYTSVDEEFVDAALGFVAAYRLPCFRSDDPPVVATQEFTFTPGDGRKVLWANVHWDEGRSQQLSSCLTGGEQLPSYPYSSIRENGHGVVFARYVFTSPTAPPEVQILYDGNVNRFGTVIREYVSGYRLPCLTSADAPVTFSQQFRFNVEGNAVSTLKDASFAAFVGALDGLESQHVRFDFTTMGCPFEVKFVLRRPYLPNEVGEVEKRDPNRREFIEWLKLVDFKLSKKDRSEVLGDSMTISVPCSVLDLR